MTPLGEVYFSAPFQLSRYDQGEAGAPDSRGGEPLNCGLPHNQNWSFVYATPLKVTEPS